MEFWDVVRARRAVRNYSNQPLEPGVVTRLIDAAIQAPSAMNKQSWLFTVVRDKELLDRISFESKQHLLSVISKGTESLHGYREHLSNPDFHIFYHAPLLVVISAPVADVWASEDAALAAQNLMLAACAEGLGTCWIGFAQHWLQTDEGRAAIGVPPDFRPIAPIIVGHPNGPLPPVPRNPPKIHWVG